MRMREYAEELSKTNPVIDKKMFFVDLEIEFGVREARLEEYFQLWVAKGVFEETTNHDTQYLTPETFKVNEE